MKYTLQVGEITQLYEGTPDEIVSLITKQKEINDKKRGVCLERLYVKKMQELHLLPSDIR
ncbi:hypothetical protein JK627_23945 [Bacillus paranthracis]|uniref:hypothetical protein n=1 Tax=Bacillus paranthracis TaxID=2026186 RepID=UPI003A7FC785